eukprot:163164_1
MHSQLISMFCHHNRVVYSLLSYNDIQICLSEMLHCHHIDSHRCSQHGTYFPIHYLQQKELHIIPSVSVPLLLFPNGSDEPISHDHLLFKRMDSIEPDNCNEQR